MLAAPMTPAIADAASRARVRPRVSTMARRSYMSTARDTNILEGRPRFQPRDPVLEARARVRRYLQHVEKGPDLAEVASTASTASQPWRACAIVLASR